MRATITNSVEGLRLNSLAPSKVQGYDSVRTSQVQASTPAFQRHQHDFGFVFRHENADGLISLDSVHVSLVPDDGGEY
jgi:hypothetical protein